MKPTVERQRQVEVRLARDAVRAPACAIHHDIRLVERAVLGADARGAAVPLDDLDYLGAGLQHCAHLDGVGYHHLARRRSGPPTLPSGWKVIDASPTTSRSGIRLQLAEFFFVMKWIGWRASSWSATYDALRSLLLRRGDPIRCRRRRAGQGVTTNSST